MSCGSFIGALQDGGAVSCAVDEGVGTIKIHVTQCRTDGPRATNLEAIPAQKTIEQW